MNQKSIIKISLTLIVVYLMFNIFSSMFGQAETGNLAEVIEKGAFLVDVRTPEEFAMGSVPGSVNIPLDEVPTRVKEFKGKGEIVVFCRTGNRSGQAKRFLEAQGIQNIINGGSWQNVHQYVKK